MNVFLKICIFVIVTYLWILLLHLADWMPKEEENMSLALILANVMFGMIVGYILFSS